MSTISSMQNLFQQTSPFAEVIEQLLLLESRDKRLMEAEQNDLDFKSDSVNEVQSKLSSLLSVVETLSSASDSDIGSLSATSTNTDAIEIISGEGLTSAGSYTISVDQLAKQSLVNSDAFVADAADLVGGTISFNVDIGSASELIEIDTVAEGLTTNKEVMEAISDEINNLLGNKVHASVFQIDADNVLLSIKSISTGESNRIAISTPTSLNLQNEHTDTNELNAQFTIDGIAFQRSVNTIDDVIEGLSFELRNPTTVNEQIEVSQDTEASTAQINDFIEKFNAVNSTIRSKTYVDGETSQRGILYGMRSIRNLTYSLREIAFQQVASLDDPSSDDEISMLSDIGIGFRNNGEMYIEDEEKLENALKTNSEAVNQLFTATDGIATKFEEQIDMFITGSDSILDTVSSGIDLQIDRLDNRIRREENYLQDYEKRLREEYARLQQALTLGQNQLNSLFSMQQGFI